MLVIECPCGQVHLMADDQWNDIKKMIYRQGSTIGITIEGRSWDVSRWFIAFHGIKAQDLLHNRLPHAKETTNDPGRKV